MNLISFKTGSRVLYNNVAHCIQYPLGDLKSVIARNEITGAAVAISTSDCKPLREGDGKQLCLDFVTEAKWLKAWQDYEWLGVLREAPHATKQLVRECMERSGWSRSTVLRRRDTFMAGGTVSSLYPRQRRRRRKRLSPEAELIIRAHLDQYKSPQQLTISHVLEHIQKDCKRAGLPVPSFRTVRDRIMESEDYRTLFKMRGHKKFASDRYEVRSGTYEEARFPLDVIQLDHALGDIILVDAKTGEPIGRPFITAGIDCNTRMVYGIYVRMHEQDFGGAGLCITQGAFPKDELLRELGINGEWPIRGLPHVIHTDNAREFRGNSMARAIQEWGIELQFRPVKHPGLGGIVERFFLTMQGAIHTLPGSTFSNPKHRGENDSEKNACLTPEQFYQWLVKWIVKKYHNKPHRGLGGLTPFEAYKDRLIGTPEAPGPGLPDGIADPVKFRLDFLPSDYRAINNEGVTFFGIWYDADIIHTLRAREKPDEHADYLFKFDPRDTQYIFYYDDASQQYVRIPRATRSRRPATKWEVKAARRRLRERGITAPSEDEIFQQMDEEQQLIAKAKKETRRQRKRKHTPVTYDEVRESQLSGSTDDDDDLTIYEVSFS